MSPRKTHDDSHFFFVPLSRKSRDILNTTVHSVTLKNHRSDASVSCAAICGFCASVLHSCVNCSILDTLIWVNTSAAFSLRGIMNAITSRNFAAKAIFSKSSSVTVAFAWGVSCLGTYRGVRNPHAKPSDQLVARPTQWSKPFSPTSPTRFGLRTLRLRSPRFVAAAFVPLSAISADNENGRVSRSRSSLPRSCVATPCETSRSFPGGNRRPF